VRTGSLGRGTVAICCGFFWLTVGSLDVCACSSSPNPTKIGREFLVGVFNHGKPVVGLKVELSTYSPSGDEQSHTVSIVTTDAEGWARFASDRPGTYYVGIKHPAYAYSEELQVMRHPPKGTTDKITFEWPGWKALTTQSVSGSLNGHIRTERGLGPDFNQPIYSTVQGAKLTLAKAVTNEIIDMQTTQESGMFTFGPVPAGFYFLRSRLQCRTPWAGIIQLMATCPSWWILPRNFQASICFSMTRSVGNLGGSNARDNDHINAQTH
jgi:hypothetical protein